MFYNKNSGVNKNNRLMDKNGKPNALGKKFLYG